MKPSTEIFPITHTYPQFFNKNLSDPNRIIKLISGKHCALRVFYYQLLKLVFEIQVKQNGQDINYSEIVLDIIKKYIPKSGSLSPRSQYLQHQASVIQKFIAKLLQNPQLQFQSYINSNVSVDTALIIYLQEMLSRGGISGASVQQVFSYLSSIFGQNVSKIEKCIKFEESDVFVYIQSQSKLYLVFLNLVPEPEQENSLDKVITSNQKEIQKPKNSQMQNLDQGSVFKKTHNDTIINIFGDMLQSSKNQQQSRFSNSILTYHLNNSLSPGKQDHSAPNKNGKYIQNNNSNLASKLVQNFSKTMDQKTITNNQGIQPKIQNINIPKVNGSGNRSSKLQNHSPDNSFYRPKQTNPTLQTIFQATASKQSLIQSRQNKIDPFDCTNESEKGTYYRQFTNTRILNLMPEPQRTTVKMLKNRFVGVHNYNLIRKN